jgi:hypothetical protein
MPPLTQALVSVDDAARLILAGRPCCIAGDEALLRRLPHGCWIGGTTPYFMAAEGGLCDRDRVFVTELPRHSLPASVRVYDRQRLSRVCTDAPDNGFSVMVLPAFSEVHEAFAQEAPGYDDMYLQPLVGWIAGVHLDELTQARPKVVNGQSGELLDNAAVVLHLPLPAGQLVQVDIVNLFTPGEGAVIEFDHGGFQASRCRVDGLEVDLHDWLLAQQADLRLPLVADYHGAMINVSIKSLDPAARLVHFYAPVFPGVRYRIAQALPDYGAAFARAAALQPPAHAPVFCCNCILNYVHGQLEGRRTGRYQGPMSFGEIGYQLLNQTLVHLTVSPG